MEAIEQRHLADLVEGNKGSLFYFHEKYQSKVYRYTFTLVRNREVAEEITSDVFIKIWEIRTRLDLNRGIDHLMFKITKDFCRDYLRKVARDAALREAYIYQCLNDKSNDIEDQLSFKDNLKIASRAIESLPPKCREVFELRYNKEMSLLQIAEELGITRSTVQKHLHKGTKYVRNYLRTHSDLVFFLAVQLYYLTR